jgi:uncharacterized membrane protein YgcG
MPEADELFKAVIIGGVAIIVIAIVVSAYRNRHRSSPGKPTAALKRQEALFVSSFPELQPNFHPEKVMQFVSAWRSRKLRPDTITWNDPPGFGPLRARLMPKSEKGQPAELLDAAGDVIASFILQDNPEGGVIRMGSGKFTVNVRDAAVRYWHPQREFKWSKAKGWRVLNALADRGIDSDDRGTSFASDSSSSSSSSRATTAAMAGAGGTFDGGGSSSSWDEGSSSGSRTSY